MVDFQPHNGHLSAVLVRHLTPWIQEALQDTPVVLLQGARQTGKSTLVRSLEEDGDRVYLTLDDFATLAAAKSDPAGFVAGLPERVTLDEVQRLPELLLAIKGAVDRHRQAGRFLLTGSANVLALPRVADSLAGRMEIQTLWPFSQGEIDGRVETFIDWAFGDTAPPRRWKRANEARADALARARRGGFPEILDRPSEPRQAAWFRTYATTVVQRTIRDVVDIEGLTQLPRLLALLASRAGGLLHYAGVERDIEISPTTLKRYVALLQSAFLIVTVPPWSGDVGRRLVKAPKLFLTDSGLLAHLNGLTKARLEEDTSRAGPLIENFVATELLKQLTWTQHAATLFHYRSHDHTKVDLVLEDSAGRLVGIEVKTGITLPARATEGLQFLANTLSKRFHRGVVLYGGTEIVPFQNHIHAVPLSALWC